MKELFIQYYFELSLIVSGMGIIFIIVSYFRLKKIEKEQDKLFYKLFELYQKEREKNNKLMNKKDIKWFILN